MHWKLWNVKSTVSKNPLQSSLSQNSRCLKRRRRPQKGRKARRRDGNEEHGSKENSKVLSLYWHDQLHFHIYWHDTRHVHPSRLHWGRIIHVPLHQTRINGGSNQLYFKLSQMVHDLQAFLSHAVHVTPRPLNFAFEPWPTAQHINYHVKRSHKSGQGVMVLEAIVY